MSISRPPRRAAAIPCHSDSSVTRSSSSCPADDLADRHGDRRVAVPAVDDRPAVDRDHVAVAEDGRRRRDAVHDLVVDRRADRRREAVVAEERRRRARPPQITSRAIASRSAVRDARARPRRAAPRARRRRRARPGASARSRRRVLIWIICDRLLQRPLSCSRANGRSAADRPLGDVVDRPHRVDADQDALLGVVADQRRGLLVVDLEPVPDGLRLVVVALEQLAAAVVADPVGRAAGRSRRARCGRSCWQVRRPESRRTTSSSSTTSSSTTSSSVPSSRQDLVELHGLRHGAREAVEQEAAAGVVGSRAGRAPSRW